MDLDVFKNNVLYLMKKYNLSTTQFAKRINMSQPCVAKWSNGLIYPSVFAICVICREFNVSADWLLFGEEK